MRDEVYARAAAGARYHLQLLIDEIVLPEGDHGSAWVSGEVVRVFRGEASELPRRIRLGIDCKRADYPAPPSGVRWTPMEELRVGRVLEAFISRDLDGKRLQIASWQSHLLDVASDEPRIALAELEHGDHRAPPVPRPNGLLAKLWALVRS